MDWQGDSVVPESEVIVVTGVSGDEAVVTRAVPELKGPVGQRCKMPVCSVMDDATWTVFGMEDWITTVVALGREQRGDVPNRAKVAPSKMVLQSMIGMAESNAMVTERKSFANCAEISAGAALCEQSAVTPNANEAYRASFTTSQPKSVHPFPRSFAMAKRLPAGVEDAARTVTPPLWNSSLILLMRPVTETDWAAVPAAGVQVNPPEQIGIRKRALVAVVSPTVAMASGLLSTSISLRLKLRGENVSVSTEIAVLPEMDEIEIGWLVADTVTVTTAESTTEPPCDTWMFTVSLYPAMKSGTV
jgi:hypothetical protein